MAEPHQSAEAKTSSPVEASSAPGNNPVQIILTPPTPIIPTSSINQSGEDTHKEVHRLPDVSEEKEVVDTKDHSEEKQVYAGNETRDEKEVSIPEAEKEVHDPGVEKEVYKHQGRHDGKEAWEPKDYNLDGYYGPPLEKEVYTAANEHDKAELISQRPAPTTAETLGGMAMNPNHAIDKPEKEFYHPNQSAQSLPTQKTEDDAYNSMAIQLYNTNLNQRQDSFSTQSTETDTQSNPGKTKSSYYQRRLDKFNEAVDKKKKAWTTFTNESNAAMVNKYNQVEQGMKDRRMAFENNTTAKLNQLDKSLGSKYDRAEKGMSSRATSFKQSMINARSQSMQSVKTLGSRCPTTGKEDKQEDKTAQ
ncbi:hypothetical protein FSARC_2594 [Fusarium sarcochroum]|uniref:Uncharacterized protein n=1 Tax=Fusarium sarcochroum TaxID=1208366 RepID=A0A8H4XCQ6_9HYPO|nr:hypothetical protein FSARC_2594 [Fusarium sarcochroum]